MCRHASYQKKVTDVGMILHRVKCATKMQGQIRGFVGRCKYRAMLKRHYAEGGDGKEVNSERRYGREGWGGAIAGGEGRRRCGWD